MIGVTVLVMLIVCGLRVLSPHYGEPVALHNATGHQLEAFAVAAPQTRLQALALRPGPMRRHPLLAAAEPGPDLIPHLDAIAALARPSPMVTVPAGWFLMGDRKSTRLNSSHLVISYAVFCLKKKKNSRRGGTGLRTP